MSRIKLRRPSATLSIAVLALVVAVAGGGQAVADTTATIAKSISGSKIKKGSITSKQIKSGTITGKQVKNDTLTGKQINESTLGTVPSATSAANATTADNVGGTFVRPFNFTSVVNSGKKTLFEHAGYRVEGECDASSHPVLTVTNVAAGKSEIVYTRSFTSGSPDVVTLFDFDPGVSVTPINPAQSHGTGTITAASVSGAVITGQFVYDNNSIYGGATSGCFVAGTLSSN